MKKIFTLILLIFLVFITVHAEPIHTYKEIIPITDNITLTKVSSFYADKNISYSYIKADLSAQDTELKLLNSPNGTDVLDTVGNLAKTDENVVAAINADFFSTVGSKGLALGIEIKDGKMEESPINPGTMATVSYLDDKVSISYLDFHIMAVAPNWQYHEIRHLNKHTAYYGDILMYTSDFNGGMSPAPGGEVVEVVVDNGIVTEFRRNQPPVKIPENGCVLVVSEGMNMFLANNFQVGDPIKFDYYITPDISNAKAAFGGGAILVSEGQVVSNFSHVISGYNPRSAIGIDKNGTTLYLVAVDGRQTSSKGMTMSELAQLMHSLGCYNAVNLDGGGSTNMVASTVWDKEMHSVNSPTENRRVINAVGITHTSTSTIPTGIMLKPVVSETLIGQPVKLTAFVHDENLRQVEGEITFHSEQGEIKDGMFVPHTSGKAIITANYGGIYQTAEIYVIDKISGISVQDSIRLNAGESANLDLYAFDTQGHYVKVTNPALFTINTNNPGVVSVSGLSVNVVGDGNAVISVEKDGVSAFVSVSSGGKSVKYTDNFETVAGSFKSYPKTVGGSFELSTERAYTGAKSGKLNFDFTGETNEAKGAYYSLSAKPVISGDCNELSVCVYSDADFNHELRAQFTDGNGELFIVSFGRNLEKGKWQKLKASIPQSAVRPLKLDSVYCLYLEGDVKDSGYVYLDDLTFKVASDKQDSFLATNKNTYAEETVVAQAGFVVGVLPESSGTLLDRLMANRITNVVNTYKGKFVGSLGNVYRKTEDYNAAYITLNTSNKGIRNSDSSQWEKLRRDILTTSKKNIFIMSDNSVFGSDGLENRVFQDFLETSGKNVFVITPGDINTYKNINGVRYFTLGNSNRKLSLNHIGNYRYLVFNFGENVSFEFKAI